MIKKIIIITLLLFLPILYSCSMANKDNKISCNIISDCPKAVCPDGYKYNKYSCSDNACIENIFIQDPCSNHYGTEQECNLDSDCGIGGCSGQICGKKGIIENTVTTCEFREEYNCLKLTSCDCANNKCAWEENDAYKNCIEQIK